MTFNSNTDKIAITVPEFTFKKGAGSILFEDITDLIYSEPYLVTVAIDSHNVSQSSLNFNFIEYPNIRRGGTVKMLGDGHLVYGPGNPGEFVAVSVLLMESSREDKDLGEKVKAIVESKAVQLGITAAITTNPTMSLALDLMLQLTKLIGDQLQQSQDTYLNHAAGVFFRDSSVAYSVNRQFINPNDFADLTVKVIPLNEPNRQGPVPTTINLPSN